MRLFLQKSVVSCLFLLACMGSVFGQLTVDFSASDSAGCGNVTPIFQDLTTSPGNPIVSWEWDFGDNTPHAFIQNPAHIYSTQLGCFDVTLIVTTNNGTIDSVTKTAFICVYPAPVIGAINVSPAQACIPAMITFTGNVTSPTPINLWLWDIPFQPLQSGQSVTDTFNTSGTLDITLLIQDANGCFADTILNDLVTVSPSPVTAFTANPPSACAAPFTTNFFSNSTLNGATPPAGTTYQWSFPGGVPANSNLKDPQGITYSSPGNFDVTLIVTAPNGCTDTLTQIGFIGVGQVISGITVGAVTCVGVPIDLTGTGASSYSWDFGCNNTNDAVGTTTTATFATPGVYCIEVNGSNGPGCDDTAQVQITVSPSPTASFTVDRTVDCKVPSVFSFDASASAGVDTFIWNFGTGSSLPAPYITTNPLTSVTYTNFGAKHVTLTVKNTSGCEDVITINNLIQISPPTANFTANVTEGCVPINIDFTNTSTSADPIVTYQWLITPPGGIIPLPPSVPIPNPTFQFNNSGNYDVRFIVTTQSGCKDTLIRNQYIQLGTHPLMGMIYDDSLICINESIQFNSVFTDTAWQYAWDFNYTAPAFNIMSSLDNPLHIFTDTGEVSIGLIINDNGCRDTLIKDDVIFIKGPKAAFSVDPTVACGIPAVFDITNNSSNALNGNTQYSWYFNNMANPYNVITKTPLQPPVNPPSPTYGGAPQQLSIKLIVNGLTTGCTDSLKQTVVVGNPIANFTVPDQIICRSTAATFNVTGSNASTYEWYFGDGLSDTTNGNTTHIYGQIDTFTVTMVAIDANSCRDTIVKPLHIRVTGPTPNFTLSDTLGCTPLPVNFVNTTTLYPGTTQTGVSWDFGLPGGGAAGWTNTGQNTPTHIFTPSGTYNVIMRIRDSDNCLNQIAKTVVATFPDSHFAANDTVTCAGNVLTFTPTIPGSTYEWTFGDSLGVTHTTTGAGVIQHSYANVGQFTVKLVVTDANGCVDSLIKTNYIVIENYSADFTGAPTSAACPPLATFFQDQSSGNIGGWTWIFGDVSNGSTLQNPGHIYTAAGNFEVTLIATHVDGCADTVTKPNFITLDGPIGSFTYSPTATCPGDTVTFTIFTDRTQTIFYELQPGNVFFIQTTTTGLDTTIIKYVYTIPGIYAPTFQIQDVGGCSYTIPNPAPFNVTVYQPPFAAFDMTPPAGCTPLTVSFTNNSTPGVGQTGGAAISNYSWNFGNGGPSSTVQNPPSQTYLTPNVYPVSLYLTDTHGCRDTLIQNLPANFRPLANFTANDTIQCAPVQIQFNDLTSITVPVAWSWTFGDGTTDTTQTPNHLYQQDGNYTVTLTVTDANGCKDTFTRTQYVFLRHPVASFVADSTSACNPFTACFNASSSQSDTLIDTYLWQFGVGQGQQLSNADSICHNYNTPGNYTVTLTVTDVLGCSDDSVRNNYIIIDQTTIPDTITVLRATVVNRNRVRVDFIPYFPADFRKYILYRKTPQAWLPVDSSTVQTTSTLIDNDTSSFDCEALSYCYVVVVENSCRKRSPIVMSKAHCTMSLSSITQTDAVKLNWIPYKGWANVLQYDIYKIPLGHIYFPNTNNMVLLGSVAGNINTFTDSTTFCTDSVHYRIVALELAGGQQESYSDVESNNARHFAPADGVEIEYATVYNDQHVEIKWLDYQGYRPAYYVLEKSYGGDVWQQIAQLPLTDLSYIDTEVFVDSVSYRYRVFADDSCGYRTRAWNVGRNIVLDASQLEDETPILNWNIYEKWLDAGVEYYEIQVWDENNGWVQVDVVGPQTLRYIDTKSSFFQSVYNYRIIAHELAGNGATSVSNQDSIIFTPKIWGANAFTPNQDGKNDVFVIKGPFDLVNFEMTIYDRWGRIVFNSRDISQGWDGFVDGKGAPEGVYTYRVSATGIKGEPVKMNGTVTLIR